MWVRRLAVAAAFLTVVLIVAGGVVTNTDSGLACPDWPTCFGSPMPRMVGGVAVEHTHRLIATAVGLCTLGLCIGTLQRRLWLLLCGVFAPVLLGGAIAFARLQQRDGSLPALPALLVLVGFAGCAWAFLRARGPGRLAVLALALVMAQGLLGGLTFLQIVLGAAIRHTGAGLVCTDLPYCRGAWWPTGVHPSVHLHMLHRALAFAVLALVCWNAVRLARGATGTVRVLAWAGPALVVAQIALGILT